MFQANLNMGKDNSCRERLWIVGLGVNLISVPTNVNREHNKA